MPVRACALLGLLAAAPSAAFVAEEDGFSLSGSVRARYETLDRQARAGFGAPDDLLAFRTIVGARYRAGAVELGAELRDSRAYLAERDSPISTGEVNALELVQAYVRARVGTAATLQAGRFVLSPGSGRLVADDSYRNTTNGFTGFRLDLGEEDDAGPAAVLFAVLPQNRLPDGRDALLANRVAVDRESFDTVLIGGVGTAPLAGARVQGGYYLLSERDGGRATRDRRLHTLTARLLRDPQPGAVDFDIEYARQFGRAAASTAAAAPRQTVSAFYLHAEAGRTWAGPWQPRLSVELEWASGDGPGRRYGRFDTLYGSRRSDLAPSGIYGAVGRANIISPALRLEVEPGPRTDAFVAVHGLWMDSATDAFATSGVRDPAGAAGRYVGTQVEGRLRHWLLRDRLQFEGNFAWLAKGRFYRAAPNSPGTANTHYLSLALTAFF
ncbi:alginate export family protein [Sphingomonas flavalba]|uniref:alginate export family protein n=1 Tax=Sphingomonas flavalba TaxID=2559804 RepID=UPI0039DF9436